MISSTASSSGFSISLATRSGSSLPTTSAAEISRSVIVSHAMLAIRAARRGTIPCQPKKGLRPTNSSGWNIILMATSFVT